MIVVTSRVSESETLALHPKVLTNLGNPEGIQTDLLVGFKMTKKIKNHTLNVIRKLVSVLNNDLE